jgi:hypothetical protein
MVWLIVAFFLGNFTAGVAFPPGLEVAAPRQMCAGGGVAASRRRTRIRRQLVCFSPAIAQAVLAAQEVVALALYFRASTTTVQLGKAHKT